MNYKITIITPTFNRAHTLERVYRSILDQNFKNLKWLVMDDGSTDDTKQLIDRLKSENKISIDYVFKPNRRKYVTLMDGIFNYINTEYFIIMDSDDAFFPNSIEIFYNEIEKIKDDKCLGSVCGNVVDSNGEFVGTKFPQSPLDCSVFEMRHKYNVKGGKLAIHQTSKFKQLNYFPKEYEGKPYVPDDIWQNIFDAHFKTRFINEIFKIYYLDLSDGSSLTSGRYKQKNAFGIMESYRTNLETNQKYFFKFPLTLSKKMIGYIYYGLHTESSIAEMFSDIKGNVNKFLFVLMLIPAWIYKQIKPLE